MLPTYLIEGFVEDYRYALHWSVSLQSLSEFHEESKIREIAKIERRKVFDAVIQQISEISGENISELLRNLDSGIKDCTEKFIATNRHHIQESESLLQQLISFISKDFRLVIHVHLSFNPYMTMSRLQKFMSCQRSEAIRSFEGHWKPGTIEFHLKFQAKLEMELESIQKEVEERHRTLLEGPVAAEEKRFQFLKDTLLQKVNRLKEDLRSPVMTSQPKALECKLEELQIFVTDQERFSSTWFCHVQYQIVYEIRITRKALSPSNGVPRDHNEAVSLIEQLALKIQREFKILSETPQMKEERIKLEINELISKKANEYSASMEPLLHQNRMSNKLDRHHRAISRRLENSLRMDIRKISNSEFIEVHCDSLKEKIGQHWLSLQNQGINTQNIPTESITEENLEEEGNVQGIGANKSTDTGSERKANSESKKCHLVFRLCRSYISMGACVNGNFKAFEMAGDTQIPLIVGRAVNRELVFGKEAVEKCALQNPPLKHWWITDYLELTNLLSCKEEVNFNVGYSKFTAEISMEFLLGYLLRSLKEHAVEEFGVCFASSVITLPSWFCSTHRIQVKDAAYISGMRKCRIVNEESAAALAYHMLVGEQRTNMRSSFVLLFSESFGVITVVLYDIYSKAFKDLKMDVLHFSSSKMGGKNTKFETALKFVREVCSRVMQEYNITPTHAVLMSEDPVCLRAFHSVALENGCKERVEITERDLLSALLAKFDDIIISLPFDEFPLEVFKRHLQEVKYSSPWLLASCLKGTQRYKE